MTSRFKTLVVSNGLEQEQITFEILEEKWFQNKREYMDFVLSQPVFGDGTESNVWDPVNLYWSKERVVNRVKLHKKHPKEA
jgi:hypothetical protein